MTLEEELLPGIDVEPVARRVDAGEREAVLGAGVVVTATTPIVDVRGEASVRTKGRIPARAIVIPGMLPKQFPAGAYATACALIVGTRNESTDLKTSLNAALREHDVAV